MKVFRNPSTVHPPVADYVHQAEIIGPGRLLALSGQIGRTLEGMVPDDAGEQLSIALDNVIRNLQAAQMKTEDLVKLTIYLAEPIESSRRASILTEKLGQHNPCMTLLYVAGLAHPDYKVELDAWASAD